MHTPLGMVGYCLKDNGKRHFRTRMAPGITAEMVEEAKREYLKYGNVTNKGMAALNPKNIFEKAETFRQTDMLDPSMPFRSIVVLMLRSGVYLTISCRTASSRRAEAAPA